MLSKEMLDILVCPFCKTAARMAGEKLACTNPQCLCEYRIEGDIPIMLIDEAKRPCPQCGSQRDYINEEDTLHCPKCGTELKL
ncbi:MAG: Trm112 family protein [Planctomycetes bacterium]|nr:Trm112 family protein [Planctomycetota bacterium]